MLFNPPQSTQPHGSRRGFSMLELLVVLACVSILLAVLLPAVQNARASSRSLICRNHLRQVGVAVHSTIETSGQFPGRDYARKLLPRLDQNALFERVRNFNFVIGGRFHPQILQREPVLRDVAVPVYQCPSDPLQATVRGRFPSYLLNVGTGFRQRDDGFLPAGDAAVTPRDVTDGLSNTVCYAEKLLPESATPAPDGSQPRRIARLRGIATTDAFHERDAVLRFASACRERAVWFPNYGTDVVVLITGASSIGGYNHIVPPNSNSCMNGVEGGFGPGFGESWAARTATSLHPSGAHVLLADGAVRFVSEDIGMQVWQALGTRNGNEVIPEF